MGVSLTFVPRLLDKYAFPPSEMVPFVANLKQTLPLSGLYWYTFVLGVFKMDDCWYFGVDI